MEMFKKIDKILNLKDKIKIGFLLGAILVGSLLELLGVSVILPIANLIMDKDFIYRNKVITYLYTNIGFKNEQSFLISLLLGVIGIYVLKNIYLICMNKWLYDYIYDSQEKMALRLFKAYMGESYIYHLTQNTANLQRSINNDVVYFYVVLLHILQLGVEVLVSVMLGIYLTLTNISLTITVLCLAVVSVICFYLLTRKTSKKVGKDNQIHSGKMIQWVNQAFNGIKEVKLLGNEQFFLQQYDNHYKKFAKGTKIYYMIQAMPKYIIEAACMAGLMLIIIVKLSHDMELINLIPQVTVFAVAAFRLLPSVSKMSTHISTILYYKPSVDLVCQDLNNMPNGGGREVNDKEQLFFDKQIEICNVEYKYPERGKKVIDKVSFNINKGEAVAFIGKSGAGKTTIVDLILGLLDPVHGKILVDGVDICENKIAWQKKIGYVPQDIFLMDGSILDNITFGVSSEKINMQKVWQAVKLAQLESFVASLDQGLYTDVGETGARISGGQRQRIGIARALYNDPDILVFDEATSALDWETEKAVLEAIEELYGEKTVIIIAHRFDTVKKCDKIYEVDGGKISLVSKGSCIS